MSLMNSYRVMQEAATALTENISGLCRPVCGRAQQHAVDSFDLDGGGYASMKTATSAKLIDGPIRAIDQPLIAHHCVWAASMQ